MSSLFFLIPSFIIFIIFGLFIVLPIFYVCRLYLKKQRKLHTDDSLLIQAAIDACGKGDTIIVNPKEGGRRKWE